MSAPAKERYLYVVGSRLFVSMNKAGNYAMDNDFKEINKYSAQTFKRLKTLELQYEKSDNKEAPEEGDPFFIDSDGGDTSSDESESDDETAQPAPVVPGGKAESKAE